MSKEPKLIHQVLIKANGHVTKKANTSTYEAICGAWFDFHENKGAVTCLECLARK